MVLICRGAACCAPTLSSTFCKAQCLRKSRDYAPKNEDLHGMVPDKSDVALILIDVSNVLEWDGGEQLLPFALPMAQRIAELKSRARDADVLVVYVNDNFGQWKSDRRALIRHCLEDDVRGKPIVELLAPDDDYFVLKPKHSGFFSTNLDILLDYLGAKTLILTGMVGEITYCSPPMTPIRANSTSSRRAIVWRQAPKSATTTRSNLSNAFSKATRDQRMRLISRSCKKPRKKMPRNPKCKRLNLLLLIDVAGTSNELEA